MKSDVVPLQQTAMFQSLQAGRAVAAILIVLLHVGGTLELPKYLGADPFGHTFEFGFISVDFFFVLSGFIIMHAHRRDVGKPAELVPYFWKRLARIYPPYWVVLALIVPVFFLAPNFGAGHERAPGVIACSIALLQHPEHRPILVVVWTVIYEVFFYFMFAGLIINKRFGAVAFMAWAAGVMAFAWFDSYPLNFLFSHWFIRILAGVGTALLVDRVTIPAPRTTILLGTLLVIATGVAHAREPLRVELYAAGGTLGCVLVIFGLIQAERNGSLQSPRWLVYLGNATYAIYLVHFPAISVLAKLTMLTKLYAFVPGSVLFVLHAALAVGAGCLFHEFVENPLHRWSRRFFRRQPAAPCVTIFADPAPQIRKAA